MLNKVVLQYRQWVQKELEQNHDSIIGKKNCIIKYSLKNKIIYKGIRKIHSFYSFTFVYNILH
jgi:hypothetical protein